MSVTRTIASLATESDSGACEVGTGGPRGKQSFLKTRQRVLLAFGLSCIMWGTRGDSGESFSQILPKSELLLRCSESAGGR